MKRAMPRYAPALSPLVLKALHHEARRRGLPMTRLADACLTEMLQRTPGWQQAQAEIAGYPHLHLQRNCQSAARTR